MLSFYITNLSKQDISDQQIASVLQRLEDHIVQEQLVLNLYGPEALPEKMEALNETIDAFRVLLRTQGVEISIPQSMTIRS